MSVCLSVCMYVYLSWVYIKRKQKREYQPISMGFITGSKNEIGKGSKDPIQNAT